VCLSLCLLLNMGGQLDEPVKGIKFAAYDAPRAPVAAVPVSVPVSGPAPLPLAAAPTSNPTVDAALSNDSGDELSLVTPGGNLYVSPPPHCHFSLSGVCMRYACLCAGASVSLCIRICLCVRLPPGMHASL
jgi:hypothetical protein